MPHCSTLLRNSFAFALLLLLGCQPKETGPLLCLTSSDDIGQNYREDAPYRDNILPVNHVGGTPLVLSGKVFGYDCLTPMNYCVMDVWQCDHTGDYDAISSEYRFRGKLITDANGEYELHTIVPANYVDNGTPQAKTIHLILTANGHETLITKLYFLNDPLIVTSDAQERILNLSDGLDSSKVAYFDFHLTPRE